MRVRVEGAESVPIARVEALAIGELRVGSHHQLSFGPQLHLAELHGAGVLGRNLLDGLAAFVDASGSHVVLAESAWRPAGLQRIRARRCGKLWCLPVRIGGGPERWLGLDTGANAPLIVEAGTGLCDAPAGVTATATSIDGRQAPARAGQAVGLAIDGQEIARLQCVEVQDLLQSSGVAVDGLLGLDAFRGHGFYFALGRGEMGVVD